MTSEPPSGNRPTGPPSGPLSGQGSEPGSSGPSHRPTEPGRPAAPPPGGSGGGYGPSGPSGPSGPGQPPGPPPGERGGTGGGRPPWWRSAPRVALVAGALVTVIALGIFFFARQGGGGGEVFLQAASAEGPDPYSKSTAKQSDTGGSKPPDPPAGGGTQPTLSGSTQGLYGGTQNVAACDVEKQIRYLTENQDKGRAWAQAAGIEQSRIPEYLRGLTPVQLRYDTRVTNYGYRDGAPTSRQDVLQAGTAVMVDDRGVPRVRCACGNPLKEPVAIKGDVKTKGQTWPSYQEKKSVVVQRSTTIINIFLIYDPRTGEWIKRYRGDSTATDDQPAPQPGGGGSPGTSSDYGSDTPSSGESEPAPGSSPPTDGTTSGPATGGPPSEGPAY
ncbi:DUF6777 domain-containing protein [Streptomyces netropsis]|uniref:DUF6777 domain-containing protein n=1 Tax=Streptomyces netropsis TaxID=55404 RepID=UPI0030D32387